MSSSSRAAVNQVGAIQNRRIKPVQLKRFTSHSPSLAPFPNRTYIPLRPLHYYNTNNQSQPLDSSHFISTVASPLPPYSTLTTPPLLLINIIASSVAASATLLFLSAIPTLLAFKRAAESMEKLLDVTREELPGTMAAVRLSGMEISDLTMELSDLGQQITQGVRGSTRAVRLAEEKLRQFTNTVPSASIQEVITLERQTPRLIVAETARSMKEKVVKGRAMWKMFFTFTKFSKMALSYLSSHSR